MGRVPWNKGHTKETHPSVMKTSQTMRRRGIDNFMAWRQNMVKEGIIRAHYPTLLHSETVAELIGVILGDGNISKFPRCERLILSSNSCNKQFIERYSRLIKIVFEKPPHLEKVKDQNCIRLSIYQKKISQRLRIPTGDRRHLNIFLPKWIQKNKKFLISCLKGLFEAEGSLSIHQPTCTYNFQFANRNINLLNFVEESLRKLGFHPERRLNSVRLRKKVEVLSFEKIIQFRK